LIKFEGKFVKGKFRYEGNNNFNMLKREEFEKIDYSKFEKVEISYIFSLENEDSKIRILYFEK
jgi:hypothetical protein